MPELELALGLLLMLSLILSEVRRNSPVVESQKKSGKPQVAVSGTLTVCSLWHEAKAFLPPAQCLQTCLQPLCSSPQSQFFPRNHRIPNLALQTLHFEPSFFFLLWKHFLTP